MLQCNMLLYKEMIMICLGSGNKKHNHQYNDVLKARNKNYKQKKYRE